MQFDTQLRGSEDSCGCYSLLCGSTLKVGLMPALFLLERACPLKVER